MAQLERRAQKTGDARVARVLDSIAAGIGAAHPALEIEREIDRLRVSGAGIGRMAARDVRLRLPEYWIDDAGGGR